MNTVESLFGPHGPRDGDTLSNPADGSTIFFEKGELVTFGDVKYVVQAANYEGEPVREGDEPAENVLVATTEPAAQPPPDSETQQQAQALASEPRDIGGIAMQRDDFGCENPAASREQRLARLALRDTDRVTAVDGMPSHGCSLITGADETTFKDGFVTADGTAVIIDDDGVGHRVVVDNDRIKVTPIDTEISFDRAVPLPDGRIATAEFESGGRWAMRIFSLDELESVVEFRTPAAFDLDRYFGLTTGNILLEFDDESLVVDGTSGSLIATYPHSSRSTIGLADGSAASATGRRVDIWDTSTGTILFTVETVGPVVRLFELGDGRLILGTDERSQLWDPESGELTDWIAAHDLITVFGTLADGRLVTESAGDVIIWDLDTETPTLLSRHPSLSSSGQTVLILPDDRLLAVASSRGRVQLLDPDRPSTVEVGHSADITDVATLGDDRFITTSLDGTALLWLRINPTQPQLLLQSPTPLRAVSALGADRVAVGGDDGNVVVFDMDGQQLDEINLGAPITAMTSVNSNLLAVGTSEGEVILWTTGSEPVATAVHSGAVTALHSSNSTHLISGGADNTFRILALPDLTETLAADVDSAPTSIITDRFDSEAWTAGLTSGTTYSLGLDGFTGSGTGFHFGISDMIELPDGALVVDPVRREVAGLSVMRPGRADQFSGGDVVVSDGAGWLIIELQ